MNPRPRPTGLPEIWGGVECSCVRLAHGTYDQQLRTGHFERDDDIDRLAGLGLRALRFPLLWDHHAEENGEAWRRTDARLQRLRELGVRPIVGLLHHGCGPLPDGFLDPEFVPAFARFARRVAERYPWVDAYTPINEPLTTARFSGLYGLWHPFHCDEPAFLTLLLRQCAATRAAMREIRTVNPAAQLVQTEDIGKTHSTPTLAYQAEFENERRWLTYDLLCGRIIPGNRMHAHLRYVGIPDAEFETFAADPCPPDILGMNYYVTSERLLDERLDHYPPASHGGNGRHAYADIPAVRARWEGLVGTRHLLGEIWERYRLPVAITEVQLACTRDEQLRWLREAWDAARSAREAGVDVVAVTPWALLGAFDWDSLLLNPRGHYENGAFDVRVRPPRRTALAEAVAELARGGTFEHPAAEGPGWWRRPERLIFPAVSAPQTGPGTAVPKPPRRTRPIAIVGANAQVAAVYRAACELRAIPAVFVQDETELAAAEARHRPWARLGPESFSTPSHASDRIEAHVHHTLDELIDSRWSA